MPVFPPGFTISLRGWLAGERSRRAHRFSRLRPILRALAHPGRVTRLRVVVAARVPAPGALTTALRPDCSPGIVRRHGRVLAFPEPLLIPFALLIPLA